MATQPNARAEQAAALLLDDLEEVAGWLAELDAERAAAEQRRSGLAASLRALMDAMPPEARARVARRAGPLADAAGPRPPARRPRGGLRDVVAFLAACKADTVRAVRLRGMSAASAGPSRTPMAARPWPSSRPPAWSRASSTASTASMT